MSNRRLGNSVTVHLSDEQAAILDQARGSIDAAAFVREGALQYALTLLEVQRQMRPSNEPSPEELVRLADAAEGNWVSLEDAIEEVHAHLAMLRLQLVLSSEPSAKLRPHLPDPW